jgi:hypothetical protein
MYTLRRLISTPDATSRQFGADFTSSRLLPGSDLSSSVLAQA